MAQAMFPCRNLEIEVDPLPADRPGDPAEGVWG